MHREKTGNCEAAECEPDPVGRRDASGTTSNYDGVSAKFNFTRSRARRDVPGTTSNDDGVNAKFRAKFSRASSQCVRGSYHAARSPSARREF